MFSYIIQLYCLYLRVCYYGLYMSTGITISRQSIPLAPLVGAGRTQLVFPPKQLKRTLTFGLGDGRCKACYYRPRFYLGLFIDRDTISVYFVFVTVILYYYLFIYLLFRQIVILCHTVSQKLTIISKSNFLCILSNVWRRADAKIRWPLRMTLTRDLDLTINVHFGPYLSTCWTEHLQIFTQAS